MTWKDESVVFRDESNKADKIDMEAIRESPGIAGGGLLAMRGSESNTTEDGDSCFAGERSAGVFDIEVLDAGQRFDRIQKWKAEPRPNNS